MIPTVCLPSFSGFYGLLPSPSTPHLHLHPCPPLSQRAEKGASERAAPEPVGTSAKASAASRLLPEAIRSSHKHRSHPLAPLLSLSHSLLPASHPPPPPPSPISHLFLPLRHPSSQEPRLPLQPPVFVSSSPCLPLPLFPPFSLFFLCHAVFMGWAADAVSVNRNRRRTPPPPTPHLPDEHKNANAQLRWPRRLASFDITS